MDERRWRQLLVFPRMLPVALALVCGCAGPAKKFSNPVVPAPPARVSVEDDPAIERISRTAAGQTPGSAAGNIAPRILRTGHEGSNGWKPAAGALLEFDASAEKSDQPTLDAAETLPVEHGEVAALVNAQPIFVEDVLLPFARDLAQARAQLSPQKYRQFKRELVERHLETHIEQELLIQALRLKLKDDQMKGLMKHLDSQVDDAIQDTVKRVGVSTVGELEIELQKAGSSVARLRSIVRNRKLAEQYLASEATPRSGFDRPDLVRYYQEHIEDYTVPAQVKWQQIQLLHARHGGKRETELLIKKINAALDAGQEMADLAKQHSDGPTASQGGVWEWTTQGSLASEAIDEALFKLPVGAVSQPIADDTGISIVRVLDRKPAGHKSFESVQDQIKQQLRNGAFISSVKEVLTKLKSEATIERFPGAELAGPH
jgi:hypothetical protein